MPRFLLDTSALSDALRGQPEPTAFLSWLDATLHNCFISVVTIHEFEFGTARLALRKSAEDRLRAADLMRLNALLFTFFSGRVLAVDEQILFRAGNLRAKAQRVCGDIGLADAILAATAEAEGLHIVTSNVLQFSATGISVIDVRDFEASLMKALSRTAPSVDIKSLRIFAHKLPSFVDQGQQSDPDSKTKAFCPTEQR